MSRQGDLGARSHCKVQVHEPIDKLRGPEQRPKSAVEICKTTKEECVHIVYKSRLFRGISSRSIVHSMAMSAFVVLAAGVAWFKKKAPPLHPSPPPPNMDVLSVLVAMLLVLLIALIFRRGGSAAAPTTASSTALPTATKAVHNYPRGPLLILWGSQTGTAEQFGNDLAREARQRGYDARSIDLEELVPEELASQIAPVVFLMSTHGEGEPTDNAIPFYTWANDTIRDAQELASLRIAVFGARRHCHRGRRCRPAPTAQARPTHDPRTAIAHSALAPATKLASPPDDAQPWATRSTSTIASWASGRSGGYSSWARRRCMSSGSETTTRTCRPTSRRGARGSGPR